MKDKKSISVGKLAALERAKALGLPVRVPAVSAFEHEAREWRRQSEGRRQRAEGRGQGAEDGWRGEMFRIGVAELRDSGDFESSEGFDWKPYQSEQTEGKKKVKNLNTASVARIARKIMAREWAMALGRGGGFESGQATIERGAEEYRKKKAAEKERKVIEEQTIHRQRASAEAALRDFGRNLLEAPKPVAPEAAEALLEKSFRNIGDTMRITWEPERCIILIEPWEEKRLRRKNGRTVPALYQAAIDNNFALSSFEKIHDPQLLREAQNDLILKNILSSFRKSPRKDLHAFGDAVAEGGRIIRSSKMDGGWKINFEPWEEMRRRNVERKGQPPIETYVIKADKDFEHITCKRI